MLFSPWRSPRSRVSKIKRLHRKGPSLAFAKDGFYFSQFRRIEFIISLRFYAVSCTKALQRVRIPDNQVGGAGELDSLSQRISFQHLVWRSIHLTPAYGMSLALNASGPPREEVRTNEGPALLLECATCR